MSTRKNTPKIEIEDRSNIGSQLAHAREIESDLRDKKRLDDSDRRIFAENLGRAFKALKAKFPDLSISSVFNSVFSEDEANALIKKRKTLIIFEGEEPNSSGLYTRANRYIQLSLHMAQIENANHPNLKAIAILNLIRGSSFDFDGAVRNRLDQKSISELNKALLHIKNKLLSNVDLEWMYEWTKDHLTYAFCETGGALEKPDGYISNQVDLSLEGLFDNEYFEGAEGAPCITIQERFCPLKHKADVLIKIVKSKGSHEDSTDLLLQSIAHRMVDLGIAENYDDIIKDIKWEYSPDQINKYLSSESQQQEAEKENTWMSRLMRRAVVHARIYIDLELRFSKEMSAWVPSLAQRFHLLDNIETSLENNESLIFCNSKGKAAKLISTSDDHEEALCGLMLYEETLDDGSIEEIWGLFIVYLWGSDSLPEEYEDLRHLRFVNGEDFYDFTHQGYTYSEDGVVHETCIPLGSSNSGYTPAPGGSLADIMLTNMAYANDDERIDSLLVKDAEKKFKFLKNLEREQLAEYTTCMAKTLSDG